MEKIHEILSYELIRFGDFHINTYHIFALLLLWVLIRIVLWGVSRFLKRRTRQQKMDEGRSKALLQLTKYFAYVIAIIVSLEIVGINLTVIWASAAAFLVAIGLGIQQIFNDAVSGLLLLFEASVSEGDIVEIDGLVGRVKQIRIRTSLIETRANIIIVVPNSKLVSENVINWSHNRQLTRFVIKVGVKYGSDVELVTKCLIEAASEHGKVSSRMQPQARMVNFGDSSLDFELLFWSYEMFMIEFVKSDLRISINKKFNENGIVIPFPQRDLHHITPPPTEA